MTRARQLRKTMSLPETLLWRELRQRPNGLKFRRQHPFGRWVLDFFCAKYSLAIEIDGIAHEMGDRRQRDMERDCLLSDAGIRTLRIPAGDVLSDPVAVAESIAIHAITLPIRFRTVRSRRSADRNPSTACGGPPPRQAGEDSMKDN